LALRGWYRSRLRAGRCGDPFVYPLSALKTSTFKLGRRESSDAQSAVLHCNIVEDLLPSWVDGIGP
jgi:hypothetical protein